MSSGIVLASGTATLANTKLSLAANYSFFDIGVDLSQFIGNTIEITNATAPKYSIRGIISTVGTGETLSATERVTNGTFDSGAGWTPGSGWAIGSGVATGTSASTWLNPGNISSSTGALFLSSLDINSVSSGSVRFYWEGKFSDWYSTTGTKYWYLVGRGYDYTYYIGGSSFTGEIDNISTKQVLTPSSTGHWIKSAPGAVDGVAWSYKHASFNPNDSAGYTYRILSTNIPGKQIASGTVSATDVKLATVDGGSMVDITGLNFSDITDEGWIKKLVPTMWLRAEDLTATLGDGDAVTTWTDKMGAYNATQSTADNKPTLQTSEINGKAVVRFDGSNDYLATASMKLSTGFTVFSVFKTPSSWAQDIAVVVGSGVGLGWDLIPRHNALSNGGQFDCYISTWKTAGPSPVLSFNTSYIFSGGINSLRSFVSTNGSVIYGTGGSPNIVQAVSIGSRSNSLYFNGDIAEIIIFNRDLSDAERNQVEKSLSAYYGITLASSNPVPSSFVGSDAYSPPSTNLQLHLKADAGCFTDAGKTTACASDADKVYVWEDQSGNGNDAVQATEGYRPLWKTNIVGTLPAMRFDGSNDYMATAAFASAITQPYSYYIVAKGNQDGKITDGIASGNRFSLQGISSDRVSLYVTEALNKPYTLLTKAMFSGIVNGTSTSLQVNGARIVGTTGTTNSLTGLTLGVQYALLAGTYLTGDIYEILIYNTAHDDLTRTQIERYLAGKWGISYTPTVYGTSPAKYLLCLYDSSSRVACGYVGAAGGGETLGAEIATGTLTAGKLYKITATEANHFYTGCAIGEYFTSVGTETCDASNKVQEVTEVEATGLHGHSTPNATDRKMSLKTTGFDPNAVTSYKIYALTGSTNIPLLLAENNLELQNEDGSYIYGKEA